MEEKIINADSYKEILEKELFDEFNNNSIYMRCLSTEYGCGYIAMNIYRDQIWEQEQTFDL